MNTKHLLFVIFAFAQTLLATDIVTDGVPNAEIIIAADAVPMVKLAAEELRDNVKKISGAELPISSTPTADHPVKIYVGESPGAAAKNVTADGLKHGAYRVVSGDDWLALIGDDEPFNRPGLMEKTFEARNPKGRTEFAEEWHRRTGEKWGHPYGQNYKRVNRTLGISEFDQHGSFNAVTDFLRSLGMRWFRPDELGEIIPAISTIPLPDVDKTVEPDFPLRYPYCFGGRYGQAPREYMLWQLRLGVNHAPDLVGAGNLGHGIDYVHSSLEIKVEHPEWFALIGGKRLTDKGSGIPCLSSQELLQQNIRYVRAVFDEFDEPMVSVMPGDGFQICQCPLCENKKTPERGYYGGMSDYVWEYVDNVGRAVAKTHPDRKILCNAYATYLLPPTKIDKLSPNVAVGICQLRRSSEKSAVVAEARGKWLGMLPDDDNVLNTYDYYLETWRDQYKGLPAFYPRAIAADLRSLKGISRGEFIEVLPKGPMILNLYVTCRLYWDADQDIDALLDDYCEKYYGPAAKEMKAFINYAEKNWMKAIKDADTIKRLHELLEAARNKVENESVYATRLEKLAEYMRPLENLRKQLVKKRGDVPCVRYNWAPPKDVVIDGKLDDLLWSGHLYPGQYHLAHGSGGNLKETRTGAPPGCPTKFMMAKVGENLVFGVKCEEPNVEDLVVKGEKNDDPAIRDGDYVEFLFETLSHSFYQITVNPDGVILDVDREDGSNLEWRSDAEIATHVGDDYWSVEMRLPITGDQQDIIDPLASVAGSLPTRNFPWYFNVCRQRPRGNGTERTAFSPTGKNDFLDPMKFGRMELK